MAKKVYTCIVCPISCKITVQDTPEGLQISGQTCKRGKEFATSEHVEPRRMLTTTVVIHGGRIHRLPVTSKTDIPKKDLKDCLTTLYNLEVKAPIRCGDVVVKDICGTGVDIVASRDVDLIGREDADNFR